MGPFQRLKIKLEQLKSSPEKYDLNEEDLLLIDELIELCEQQEHSNKKGGEGPTQEEITTYAMILKMILDLLSG